MTGLITPPCGGPGRLPADLAVFHHPGAQHRAQELQDRLVADAFLHRLHELLVRNRRKTGGDVRLDHPPAAPPALIDEHLQGVVRRPPRAEPEAARQEVRLEDRLEHDLQRGLHDPVADRGNRQRPHLVPYPGLGISTRRAGIGRYRLSRSSLASSPSSRATPYSSTWARVILSMPGAPLFRRTATHARHRTSLRMTLSSARGTSARDRPWPPGKAHAARHGPDQPGHPGPIPKRRD